MKIEISLSLTRSGDVYEGELGVYRQDRAERLASFRLEYTPLSEHGRERLVLDNSPVESEEILNVVRSIVPQNGRATSTKTDISLTDGLKQLIGYYGKKIV